MKLTYAQLSSVGPVRTNNEDWVGFWEPDDEQEYLTRGAVAAIADGVGGLGRGEVASRLAVETAIRRFLEVKPGTLPRQSLFKMLTAANTAVYDRSMSEHELGKMATTLTIALFRNNEINIGHVGDCRAFLVQGGKISQVTTDHNYAAQQLALGLISPRDAATSDMRCMLTRSIGRELTVQIDYHTLQVNRGDILVQCSDGMHFCVTEQEILDFVTKLPPAEACRELIRLAERRGTDDNLSVQIVHVERVNTLSYFRGQPVFHEAEIPMTLEVEVGQILDNRFQIESVVSRSGMASIFKAIDLKSNQTVAVKIPFMRFESDPAFFSRFQREEEIGKTLDHPGLLKIFPTEEKTRPYIVMEFLQGQTLRNVLHTVKMVPVGEALDIAASICNALDYMHQHNIVHRDMKPENIMICDDGRVKIMDFGIAKATGMRRITFTGFSAAMGTPDYMAPEQVRGKRGDARTDVYSLGAILYEMVTGQPPFEGTNPLAIMNARLMGDPIAPSRLNPNISPQVEEIILHALEQRPENRYASAAEMKTELENPEKVVVTGRANRLRPPAQWTGRWRPARSLIFALVPIIVFGLLWLFFRFAHH
ncbi:MAG TPA: bifunctional protein-serine/threonine kinase/phosphatase [Pirellulales bacterium]|jgi:serine/threonine-protein kinase|nr:bifunctional protein-serine/threonine kinase/phosphatase [Pirellulales bacterium]